MKARRLHDGRTLRASDVVACLERAPLDPASEQREHLTAVRSLEAPNPRTLIIRTEYPFGPLSSHLSNVFLGVEAVRRGDPPVGTGPYSIRPSPRPGSACGGFARAVSR